MRKILWALASLAVAGCGDHAPPTAASQAIFQATVVNRSAPPRAVPENMVWIPGGEFSMGAEDPEGSPIHRVYVDGFWMDRTEVTNAEFDRFVRATGYVTIAERTPTALEHPTAPPENLFAGSVVFTPPKTAVPLDTAYRWWSYQAGANWRHPFGEHSGIEGHELFPVVHIAYPDAEAYAAWAHKRLPTEAEFEFAARGGLTGKRYAWGDELRPGGRVMANTFQGHFPNADSADDGFAGIAPVSSFPPNAYGLHDITGNVWEWCSDWFRPDYYAELAAAGRVARNPKGPQSSFDPDEPTEPKRVHRGGSFLCASEYCTRYQVGARGKGEISTGTNHLGFRTVVSR